MDEIKKRDQRRIALSKGKISDVGIRVPSHENLPPGALTPQQSQRAASAGRPRTPPLLARIPLNAQIQKVRVFFGGRPRVIEYTVWVEHNGGLRQIGGVRYRPDSWKEGEVWARTARYDSYTLLDGQERLMKPDLSYNSIARALWQISRLVVPIGNADGRGRPAMPPQPSSPAPPRNFDPERVQGSAPMMGAAVDAVPSAVAVPAAPPPMPGQLTERAAIEAMKVMGRNAIADAIVSSGWSAKREIDVLLDIADNLDCRAVDRLAAMREIRQLWQDACETAPIAAHPGQSQTPQTEDYTAQDSQSALAAADAALSVLNTTMEKHYADEKDINPERTGGFFRRPADGARRFDPRAISRTSVGADGHASRTEVPPQDDAGGRDDDVEGDPGDGMPPSAGLDGMEWACERGGECLPDGVQPDVQGIGGESDVSGVSDE